MKLSELLQGVEVLTSTAPATWDITGVAYDSREVQPGDVFVAISGFATDGNRYIDKAMARGARLVVTERIPTEPAPYVQVPSARRALAQMGANWYGHPAERMTMVGVTGTNGKTSVTLLLKSVLEQVTGARVGLVGTIQNMIGQEALPTERTTPESFALQGLLARMAAAGCRYVVMEVSSHALALDRVGGIHFQAAAFTNLTEDHLDFHGTMENYARAKALLFGRCDVGVLNADDPYCSRMLEGAACRSILTSEQAGKGDLVAQNLRLGPDQVSFDLLAGEKTLPVRVGIPGLFTAYNALTVLGLAQALGLPLEQSAEALGRVQGVKGRIEVVPTPGTGFTVLIDYAHTPDSLENILCSARGFARGRVVAVFGCGGDRDRQKRPVMGRIGVELSDWVVFTSDNPRTEHPMAILLEILAGATGSKTPWVAVEDRRSAIRFALDHGRPGDVIVLAGKGHETYQEVDGVKRHLDEREEVAAWLAAYHRRREV
ncbi:MAG: UDP-N-acetylmuramoyl-L-alanyl-D-glutamate--2,6-diaminopimelate ligase [Oscillospiraceae bacterium]|mgnify:FL=1